MAAIVSLHTDQIELLKGNKNLMILFGVIIFNLNGFQTVSYTHLDVYKRQALGGSRKSGSGAYQRAVSKVGADRSQAFGSILQAGAVRTA